MAWTASGLYTCTFRDGLKQVIVLNLALATHKIALYNNSDTPDYTTDPSSYSSTNEVSGTGWAAGGVLLSAAAAGPASVVPTVTQSPSKTVMWDFTNDVSVASTTLTNAYGAKIYADALTPKANIIGIYFGGSAYTTSSGTFAITINALGLATIQCAA